MLIVRHRKQIGILILFAIIMSANLQPSALSQTQKSKSKSAKLFDYDKSLAFDLKEESVKEQDGITIQDVNYNAYNKRHDRIKAYIVKPKGKGTFAGIVFFHWLGETNSNRNEFFEEAVSLAKQGVVSLLIQGFFPWTEKPTEGEADRQQIIEQAIEVRRALDLLLSQPNVDPKRIGYVGHDYGAMYGSIISGVDKRIKAYILMAGMGNFSDWSLKYWRATSVKGKEAYQKAVEEVNPIHYVPHAAPSTFLFQFSKTDIYISKETAMAFYNAASGPKQIRWYDAEHDLNVESARTDRRVWLEKQFGLVKLK